MNRLVKFVLSTAAACLVWAPQAFATPVNYLVIGVIASSKNQDGVALLKQKSSGRVEAHRVGDHIEGGMTITKVERKHIELTSAGKSYKLTVGAESAEELSGEGMSLAAARPLINKSDGIALSGDTLTVNATLRDHLERNLGQVLMQAASEPYIRDGALVGFSLWDIEAGSIYELAGLKNGDVITHINGQPLNDAGKAIRMLNSIRASSSAELTYKRNDQEQTLKLVVK